MGHFTLSATTLNTFTKGISKKQIILLTKKISLSMISCLFGNIGFGQDISWDFGKDTENKLP
ncbi:MAG: hypothetical protein ABI359_07995, partial [Ginsengibacter sp.]